MREIGAVKGKARDNLRQRLRYQQDAEYREQKKGRASRFQAKKREGYAEAEPLWFLFLTEEERKLPKQEKANLRYERDDAYRERMLLHSRRQQQNPAYRLVRSQEEYKAKQRAYRNKRKQQDPTYREREKVRRRILKQDPAYRERILAYERERYKKDPSKERARLHRRRALKNSQHDGTVTAEYIAALFAKHSHCLYCGKPVHHGGKVNLQTAEIDHMDPLHLGGLHSQFNLAVVCHSCNSRKINNPFEKWIATLDEPFRTNASNYYGRITPSNFPVGF